MKKSLSTLILISLVSFFMLPAIMPVVAQTSTPIKSLADFDALVMKIVTWFSGFVLLMAVLFILVAAWTFLTAGGNPESVAKARQMLIYALIGIAVAVLAWGMKDFVVNVLTVSS